MAKLLQQNPNIAQVKFVWLIRFNTNFYIRSLPGRFRLNLNWLRWVVLTILFVQWASQQTPYHTLRPLAFLPSWPMRNKSSPPPLPILLLPLVCYNYLKYLNCKIDNLFSQPRCLLACFAQWPPLRPWSSLQPRDWNLWMAGHPHWTGLQSRR